jgi:transcription antitermination factor NusG
MAYWAVARTLARHESLAADCLTTAGFEIFVPKTKTVRGTAPLFPGYLFVRIVDRWRAVDRTLGVLGLIKCGVAPAKCPDVEIAALQSRIDSRGLVRLPPPPKRRRPIPIGAKVRVSGLSGLYVGQSARHREQILIDLLGREVKAEIVSVELELTPLMR